MTASAVRARVVRQVREQGPVAARVLVVAAVAWQVTLWAGARHPPVYAVFAPLMALRSDPFTSMTAVLMRILGVLAGVALGLSLVTLLSPSFAALVVLLALALFLGLFVGPGNAFNPQIGLSSLLVLSNPTPDAYGLARVWETAMGGLVTIVLAPLLWPPNPRRELESLARDCAERLTAALAASVTVLGDPAAARANRVLVEAEAERLAAFRDRAAEAQRAMRFNPLRRRDRGRVAELAGHLAVVAGSAQYAALLAVEADALSGRGAAVSPGRTALPSVVDATGRTVSALLAGADPAGPADEARRLLDAYRRADPQPTAVALRRPFLKLLDTCVP